MAYIDGFCQREFKSGGLLQDQSLASFECDGILYVDRPQRRGGLPVRQLMLFFLAIFAFKVFLFLSMGAAVYGSKIESLSIGGAVERAAARFMVLDPVSSWVANEIRHLGFH